jgi:WD40 repeat protein
VTASAETGAPPTRALELGAFVTGLAFSADGATLAASTGSGRVHFLAADPEDAAPPRAVEAHRGAALALAPDPKDEGVVTGGDDGRVVRARRDGAAEELLAVKGRWIEALASHRAGGALAAVAGREIHLLGGPAPRVLAPHPSTVADLCFSPDGSRLAAAHYDGVSIWLTGKPQEPARKLSWKGSHVAVRYSPSARFLATATQENAIHVWRLANAADMQMQGYPTKPRSLAWTHDGMFLTSSGAEVLVLWGFAGKGPEGQPPTEIACHSTGAAVAQVAAHPAAPFVAAGFSHGSVEIGDIAKKRTLALAPPVGSPASALAWSPDGWRLAVGTESGLLRLFDLRKRP